MKHLSKICILFFFLLFSCSSDDSNLDSDSNPLPQPNSTNYVLGGTGPAGGKIFYLDGSGHGYEMAPTIGTAKWQNITDLGLATNVSGLGTVLGTGETNTQLIVNALGNGNYAAKMCDNYQQNGFTDWFLPSKDELIAIYNFFDTCGCESVSPINNYWSSTQGANAGVAWNTDFTVNGNTTQFNNLTFQLQKDQEIFVKPIRKF